MTIDLNNKKNLLWKNNFINEGRIEINNIEGIRMDKIGRRDLNKIVKNKNWPRFFKRLWQRDYYERIIRNKEEYLRIKKYIKNNPEKMLTKIPLK